MVVGVFYYLRLYKTAARKTSNNLAPNLLTNLSILLHCFPSVFLYFNDTLRISFQCFNERHNSAMKLKHLYQAFIPSPNW